MAAIKEPTNHQGQNQPASFPLFLSYFFLVGGFNLSEKY